MNERKATWQCPVCDGPAKYGTLAIDAFFKLIISQSPDAEEIEVFPDGSWKALSNKPGRYLELWELLKLNANLKLGLLKFLLTPRKFDLFCLCDF